MKIFLRLSLLMAMVFPGSAFAASENGFEFISFLGFTLEAGDFSDVAAKLGKAEQVPLGSGNEAIQSICYVTDNEVVGFTSGSEHDLEGFTVAVKTQENGRSCQPLPANYVKDSSALAGLHLGMSKKEFTALVGPNVNWDDEVIGSRYFASRQIMTAQELRQFNGTKGGKSYFDVGVSVNGRFSGDRLVYFEVNKFTTY